MKTRNILSVATKFRNSGGAMKDKKKELTKKEEIEEQLNNFYETYKACESKVDPIITCATCFYFSKEETELPCSECYSEILGLPINPTKWKEK